MNPAEVLSIGVLLVCISMAITSTEKPEYIDNYNKILNQSEYSKVFRLRRIEHSRMIKNLQKGDHIKNFTMIRLAFQKIFTAIGQTTKALDELKYKPEEGFSMEPLKQQSLILLLESTCLAADMFLHFPEISYDVLGDLPKWRETIYFCLDFVNAFPVTDVHTHALMLLVYQQIYRDFEEKIAVPDYVNPTTPAPKKKKRLKLKRGPGIVPKSEL